MTPLRKAGLLLFLLSVFFCFASTLHGTTYYVDYVSGDDANGGQAKTAPFKHCPGDGNAAGNAASTSLSPGDRVVFKGGVEYVGRIDVKWSGAAGASIVYDGNSDGSWGDGRAVISGRQGSTYLYYHAINSSGGVSFIEILHFDIGFFKNNERVIQDQGAVRLNAGDTHWLISDCVIHEPEDWEVTVPVGGSGGSILCSQNCVFLKGGDSGSDVENIEIANCEFYGGGDTTIYMIYTRNVSIHDCDFGGAGRGAKTGFFSVAVKVGNGNRDLHIRDNDFHDGWQYEGDEQEVKAHAGDWIHLFGTSGNEPHDILIERNFFYNDKAFDYAHGSADSLAEDAIRNLTYRNNIFVNPHSTNGAIKLKDLDYCTIYNNLFVSYAPAKEGSTKCLIVSSYVGDNVEIENNVFVTFNTASTAAAVRIVEGDWDGLIDYNVYYTPSTYPVRCGSENYSLSQWQGKGKDLHSYSGDPKLKSLPSGGSGSGSGQYELTAESTLALDRGLLQTSFSDDFLKVSRPKGAAWDIGPYEFDSEGDDPDPPEDLKIEP